MINLLSALIDVYWEAQLLVDSINPGEYGWEETEDLRKLVRDLELVKE